MKIFLKQIVICLAVAGAPALSIAQPIVSNVEYVQVHAESEAGASASSTEVLITYDLESAIGSCEVSVEVSTDGGSTYTMLPSSLSGDVGSGIEPGNGKSITWDIMTDMPDTRIENAVVRILADDGFCNDCVLWSEPDTWGGTVPVSGEEVMIPMGTRVLLDVDTADLAGLRIMGELIFNREDLNLTSDWIMVMGRLTVGSPETPFTHQAIITLTDDDTSNNIMGMGTRGLVAMGNGIISMHGESPDVLWTKIEGHAEAGDSDIDLMESVDWEAGDQIIVAPTDYYGVSETERFSIDSITTNGASNLELSSTLDDSRWGLLQYATSTGMSLTPDDSIVLPAEMEGTPTVLDQRAEVANLTRNIVVQAPDDNVWRDEGFGAHIMIMGHDSNAQIDGVEIRRGGQSGILGRYPFHCHLKSYEGGVALEDASDLYIRNSVVNESSQRGIVVHGTNGMTVQNNIIYDVLGHAIFTEDAVERRNTFDGNVVMRVRNPAPANALRLHEYNYGAGFSTGSSAFWLSNPDNIITNNVMVDAQGFGFWFAFPPSSQGPSSDVALNPSRVTFGVFDDNISHTTGESGLTIDNAEIDWASNPDHGGQVAGIQYWSSDSETGIDWDSLERFHLNRFTVWKSNVGGIWDRAYSPTNTEIISADNTQRFFAGSGAEGIIQRCLVVGQSLNSNGVLPVNGGNPVQSAFATYHSTFDIINNIAINFPLVQGERSGVFATDDYYTRPVEKGTIRNSGNMIINSHPGYKLRAFLSGDTDLGFQEFASWYSLASTLWDPDGVWGPAGNFFVYDTPFLTYGLAATDIAPNAEQSGGVSVPGPFYSFYEFVLHGQGSTPPQNQPYDDLMAINVRRLDENLDEVATWRINAAGASYWSLAHMRDFAAHHTGIFEITFPDDPFGITHPTNFSMRVENMLNEEDVMLLAIHYDGMLEPYVRMAAPGDSFQYYGEMASLEEVRESAGETFWQDTANNLVWVKIAGDAWTPYSGQDVTADDLLYEPTTLHIHE